MLIVTCLARLICSLLQHSICGAYLCGVNPICSIKACSDVTKCRFLKHLWTAFDERLLLSVVPTSFMIPTSFCIMTYLSSGGVTRVQLRSNQVCANNLVQNQDSASKMVSLRSRISRIEWYAKSSSYAITWPAHDLKSPWMTLTFQVKLA